MKLSNITVFIALCCCLILLIAQPIVAIKEQMLINGKLIDVDPSTPALYQYINAQDDNFKWEQVGQAVNDTDAESFVYHLKFVSLRWLSNDDVDKSLWEHDLTVIVPWKIESAGTAALYITGCNNDSESCRTKETGTYKLLAKSLGAPLAILTQVPNARMIFTEDPTQKSRYEDNIVAYTWRHVLEHPSRPDWLVYFPMAKAAVRSLRVLEEWSMTMLAKNAIRGQSQVLPAPITRFYIAGASKRGMTTWLASAYYASHYPEKIIGCAPLVFDVLNFKKSIEVMYKSLGAFSFALQDYMDQDLVRYFNLEDTDLEPLVKHIDLLQEWYIPGLSRVSKLVINAIGDEFFFPLNDHVYWDQLPEPKLRLMVPDAEHSLITGIFYLFNAVAGHFRALARQKVVPQMKHQLDYNTNTLTLWASPRPTNVGIFRGLSPPTNPPRLDFRMIKLNIEGSCQAPAFAVSDEMCANPTDYKATELAPTYDNVAQAYKYNYTQTEAIPQNQWQAMWIIASWDGEETGSQVYSTQVMVLPNTFPFASCFGTEPGQHCSGDVV